MVHSRETEHVLIAQLTPAIPFGIKLKKQYNTQGECTTVTHLNNVTKSILLGRDGGMKILQRSSNASVVTKRQLYWPEVSEYRDEVCLASYHHDDNKVHVTSYDEHTEASKLLFKFQQSEARVNYISSNGMHVVAKDTNDFC